MNPESNYLHNMVGKVIELHFPYKAVVAFKYKEKQQRALLRADKLILNGQNVALGKPIDSYLQEGSTVKFSCHGFDESGQDRCGYFVTMAWIQDLVDLCSPSTGTNVKGFLGINNACGVVLEVSHRQGVITYIDANGQEHSVLFLASKLYLSGKRLGSKQNLETRLNVEDKVQFDAVPCVQSENDSSCSWFATVVWKGKKPYTDYDDPVFRLEEPRNLTAEIKHIAYNPRSMFIRGQGEILHILNEEYGVALAAMKPNSWESILFHRSVCFLFKLNLASHDLTKIFKEGDRIRFIAARASKHLITQWVASQISVCVSNELDYNF